MASENELREDLKLARRRKHESQKLIKKLTDQSAPKGAKKAYREFKAALRRVLESMRKRIPVLREKLKKKQAGGAKKAVAWAHKQIGTVENPPYSNWGPSIGEWITYTGYSGPVFWCGCFVCYAVVHEGGANIPNRNRLGFDGYINADANAGVNGLKRVGITEAKKGDIVTFDFHHIALVAEDYNGSGLISSIDGNTSPPNAADTNNGGGVWAKSRPTSQVVCVARPSY